MKPAVPGVRVLLLAVALVSGAPRAGSQPADDAHDGLWTRWSATPFVQYRWIEPPEDDDDVGGFFDQYEYTPNKGSAAPFELGVRDGALDLLRDEAEPLLQLRFQSPTSNLGLSGSDIDQPFFDQRLDGLGRLPGLDLDFFYRRVRTEQLRLFPNTAGPGLAFDDRTSPDDRFFRDRTGFRGELRLRPTDLPALGAPESALSPELSLRGGYQSRDGTQQLRFLRDPSNDWIGLARELERSVGEVGGGLLVRPGGLFTLSLDFDYERFRFDSGTITEGALGFPAPGDVRAVGFVPSSDRYTGSARLAGRIGEAVVLEAGFQIDELEQVAPFTPAQATAGLRDNRVRLYAADLSLDARLARPLSFHGSLHFDLRDNDIDRGTVLFNPSNGTQLAPFVDQWRRFLARGELEWRLRRMARLALGVRYEDVSRDLDFPEAGALRVLPANAALQPDTRIVTVYGRASLRAWGILSLRSEIGYRLAPQTGYIVDLDDDFYGRLRASTVVPWPRPLSLSAFVEGSTGENDEFSVLSGLGPDPPGPRLRRSYGDSSVSAGITASLSPIDRLHTWASLFYASHRQDVGLDLSSLQRFFQDFVPIQFTRDGGSRFENEQLSLVLGSDLQLGERTDARLRYGFTHARIRYRGQSGAASCLISGTSCLGLISANQRVDSDTHTIDAELGRWLRPGLRLIVGYRLQLQADGAPVVQSVASVVQPFDPSTHQHTVTLGVTLTSDFFEP